MHLQGGGDPSLQDDRGTSSMNIHTVVRKVGRGQILTRDWGPHRTNAQGGTKSVELLLIWKNISNIKMGS